MSKLNWAIGLYILSFFLPVLTSQHNQEVSIYGWEVARHIIAPQGESLLGTTEYQIIGYIVANIPNPLILIVIILKWTKSDKILLIWILSTIAVITALFWSPFFFSILLINFQMGYWIWLISIFLIHFFVNDSSFKRPSKRTPIEEQI